MTTILGSLEYGVLHSVVCILVRIQTSYYDIQHAVNIINQPSCQLQFRSTHIQLTPSSRRQGPRKLLYYLEPNTEETVLLRLVTLLASLTAAAARLKINPALDLPPAQKVAAPDTM